jgi:cyclophilin family peptidyl-prolyl cis-trans isomerase/HEAT repeat protein
MKQPTQTNAIPDLRSMRFLWLCICLCTSLFFTACVPVEEKEEIPAALTFDAATLQHVYTMQQDQDTDSLILLLASEDPTTRYAAARAFASIHDSLAVSPLINLLRDEHQEIRALAAYALGQIGDARSEGSLTGAFDGRDSARMYERANSIILEAMGHVGTPQYLHALSTIATYLPGDTLLLLGQVRGIYRYALRKLVDPEGTATMVKYVSDKAIPIPVRIIAANYLHRAADIDLTPHKEQLISNWHGESEPYLRICLATALGKIKSPEALKTLLTSLATESDYRVKSNMLRALQQYDYNDVHAALLSATSDPNPAIAEVAAQYFVTHGKEKDTGKYRAAMADAPTWQAKTRLAESANKFASNMFNSFKISLSNDIKAQIQSASNPYEKAAWLKAWGSELRNFESIPSYFQASYHPAVRTQAVTTLIEACRDKNFDAYFAGEGYLIKSQIGGYLGNAIKSGDAGMLALIADAIVDPTTGLKEVMANKKNDLNKAIAGLKLPDEMETYLSVAKALKEYGIESPAIPDDQKKVKPINWTLINQLKPGSKVTLSTTKGDILIQLYPDRAPGSVSNFLDLSAKGFYNNKAFHRVVPNFVIQTGCPRGDGYGSLDFTIRSELAETYYDDEGYIGMASAGPHTEGTQFFITHSPTPHLDGRYTIFGKVITGMDVVHRISMGDAIKSVNIQY